MRYVHNQWYDISCATLYIPLPSIQNKLFDKHSSQSGVVTFSINPYLHLTELGKLQTRHQPIIKQIIIRTAY